MFLDANKLSGDGTVAITSFSVFKDHQYVAYGTAVSGSDWNEIQVMDIVTKKLLTDKIKWVKFSGVVWKGDGFYYSRYDEPNKGTELSKQNEFQKVYFHKLGTPQSADELVVEYKAHPLHYFVGSCPLPHQAIMTVIQESYVFVSKCITRPFI